MDNTLSLWVWENVLSDYTDGVVFVLAETAQHAVELLRERDPNAAEWVNGLVPVQYTSAVAFTCWGGA